MIVFLENEDCIESFIKENKDFLIKVREQQFENTNPTFKLELVYHSVPLACIKNPLYRLEFMAKLGSEKEGVIHVLDCPESNRLQNVRTKAMANSHLIR